MSNPRENESERDLEKEASRAAAPALNLAATLKRLMGNRALLQRIMTQFQPLARAGLAELHVALEARDQELIRQSVHRFRGQAATFDAEPLLELLDALEGAALGGRWREAEQTMGCVEASAGVLLRELARGEIP